MTTFEEVRMCPICKEPGEQTSKSRGVKRSSNIVFTCKNPRCRWFETTWLVTVQEDGSIHERTEKPNDFPKLPEGLKAASESYLKRLEADLQKPTGPGTR